MEVLSSRPGRPLHRFARLPTYQTFLMCSPTKARFGDFGLGVSGSSVLFLPGVLSLRGGHAVPGLVESRDSAVSVTSSGLDEALLACCSTLAVLLLMMARYGKAG